MTKQVNKVHPSIETHIFYMVLFVFSTTAQIRKLFPNKYKVIWSCLIYLNNHPITVK